MDPDQERKHLAQADRHIAEVKKHITRQRAIVQSAIEKGLPSLDAETLLKTFEGSLRAFEGHRQLILGSMATGKGRPLQSS